MRTPEKPEITAVHINTARTWSGGEVQTYTLVKGLNEKGINCVLISQPGSPLSEKIRGEGITANEVRMRGEWDLLAVLKLRNILKRISPDILHLHTSHAHTLGFLAAKTGFVKKTLVTRRMDYLVKGFFSRSKYRKVDFIAAISTGVKKALIQSDIPEDRIEVIHSSLQPVFIPEKSRIREELDVPSDTPLIGCVASLHERKGHRFLFRAFTSVLKEFPDATLLLAGDGPLGAELKQLASDLGISKNVVFLGFRKDIPNILAGIDLFVLPSLLEGLGVSLLEASHAELPIIASKTGGTPDVVKDGETGLLAPPGDSQTLAQKILYILKHPSKGKEMGRNAKSWISKEFSAEAMVNRYIKLYKKLLGM